MQFGLELPQYHDSIMECRDTIKKVEGFLKEHDATDIGGRSYILGAIRAEDDESPENPCGILFRGPSKLAEAVAKAFPQYRVMDSLGHVVAPAVAPASVQAAAVKNKPTGPRG